MPGREQDSKEQSEPTTAEQEAKYWQAIVNTVGLVKGNGAMRELFLCANIYASFITMGSLHFKGIQVPTGVTFASRFDDIKTMEPRIHGEMTSICVDEEKSSGSTTILSDYSLPDYEVFYLNDDHIEEKSSGSTTTHADFSQYDSFIFDLSFNPFPPVDRSDFYHEEFTGELAHIISPSEEPRVHVPNVLPTHPTLHLDSDFTISSDSLGSDLVVSFPSGTRNKIFDPGIFIRVQSKIFLSRDAFSISFIREEQSPHLSSYRGLKALNEIPMMISRGDTPILDVLIARIFEASRARGFVLRSLELHILSFIWESNVLILSTNVYL
ncbi:hypothetical protein Tco_0228333 [Tanacetum coccineum]